MTLGQIYKQDQSTHIYFTLISIPPIDRCIYMYCYLHNTTVLVSFNPVNVQWTLALWAFPFISLTNILQSFGINLEGQNLQKCTFQQFCQFVAWLLNWRRLFWWLWCCPLVLFVQTHYLIGHSPLLSVCCH